MGPQVEAVSVEALSGYSSFFADQDELFHEEVNRGVVEYGLGEFLLEDQLVPILQDLLFVVLNVN